MPSLETIDPTTASGASLRALANHLGAIRTERMPGDPPLDTGAVIAGLQLPGPTRERQEFLLWQDGQVVARAGLILPGGQRRHQAETELSVLAGHRRQGLARRLLVEVARVAEQSGRSVLLTTASSRLPSGEAVLRHLGAQLVMQQQFMELDLQGLPPRLLSDWTRQGEEAAPGYLVWSHLGPYPHDRLPAVAQVYDVMQTAPRGAKDEAVAMTPHELQRQDDLLLAGGRQRLTTFAEHRQSGSLVAFTELFWDVSQPEVLIQHGTAVHPEHRRHSLGRWIKATNLQAAQRLHPEARFVRAGNTDDNTGMLRINHALGFRAYLTHTDWQIDLGSLRAYLGRAK